jgi:hypothetical protein
MVYLATMYHDKAAFGGVERMTAQWRIAPVNGVWRLEHADFHGHRLTVYRSRPGAYRAYLDGRMLGLWRSKETAMAAAEWAALAHNSRPPAPSQRKVIGLPRKKA